MYLYEIPRDSKLKLSLKVKAKKVKGKKPTYKIENCTFHHIDGMYSYITRDSDDAPLHLSAVTPMRKVKDHYELDLKKIIKEFLLT